MIIAAPTTHQWTEEEDFAAEMTNRQFAALQKRLDKAKLLAELASLRFISQIQKGRRAVPIRSRPLGHGSQTGKTQNSC